MKPEIIRMQIRIPKLLQRWLKDRAIANNRSMNGEIVDVLRYTKNIDESNNIKTQGGKV